MRQSWDGNVIDFIYDENNQPFAMRYKASGSNNYATYYYILNVQGDVIGLLNANGAIAAKYTYDPWGKVTVQSPNGTANTSSAFIGNINPLRYRGYYYDNDTGLYYLQSRYYDPAIGRFINADTYTTTDADGLLSTNMFAYCENNPVMGSDPTGEWVHLAIGAAIGAAINVATSYVAHSIAGESYSIRDAITDAAVGAASGALAASGVGKAGQTVLNGLIGGVSAAYTSYKETGKVSLREVGKSAFISAAAGWYGGNGLTNATRVSNKIKIINANIHCITRSSAKNAIKHSYNVIRYDVLDTVRRFITASNAANSVNVLTSRGER